MENNIFPKHPRSSHRKPMSSSSRRTNIKKYHKTKGYSKLEHERLEKKKMEEFKPISNEYEIQKFLGQGSYGIVAKVNILFKNRQFKKKLIKLWR